MESTATVPLPPSDRPEPDQTAEEEQILDQTPFRIEQIQPDGQVAYIYIYVYMYMVLEFQPHLFGEEIEVDRPEPEQTVEEEAILDLNIDSLLNVFDRTT